MDCEFTENLVDKDINLKSDVRAAVPQGYSNTVEYSRASIIDNHKNDQLLVSTIEKSEIEKNEKFEDIEATSNVDEAIQNNSKEETRFEKSREETRIEPMTIETEPKWLRKRNRIFCLLDSLISVSIVGPLVIGFWRGIWTWMDIHSELFPSWFCLAFGAILHAIFAIFQNRLYDIYASKWTNCKSSRLERLPYHALSILYIYTFGVACNAHWRGCWIIIDDFLFTHIWITVCLMCLLLACLAILRCIRNLIAPPLIIFVDTPQRRVFQFPTRYNVIAGYYRFQVTVIKKVRLLTFLINSEQLAMKQKRLRDRKNKITTV